MPGRIPKPFTSSLDYGEFAVLLHCLFGRGSAQAAQYFRVHPTTIWRWRCGCSPLPRRVAQIMLDLADTQIAILGEARQRLRVYLARQAPPRRPRGFQAQRVTGECSLGGRPRGSRNNVTTKINRL